MMTKLLYGVEKLLDMELTLANKDHGDRFHSLHEGYGVLREELDEAKEERQAVSDAFGDIMYYIRTEKYDELRGCLTEMRHHAVLAACEYIQVAAMCNKMLWGMEEGEHGDK